MQAAIPLALVGLGAFVGLRFGLVRIALGLAALALGPMLSSIIGQTIGPHTFQWITSHHVQIPPGLGLPLLTAVLSAILLGMAIQVASAVVNRLPVVSGLNRFGGLAVGAAGGAILAIGLAAIPMAGNSAITAIASRLPYFLTPVGLR